MRQSCQKNVKTLVIEAGFRYNGKYNMGTARCGMNGQGFIHDMMDVKILILYTLARLEGPVDAQCLYELCYQDDLLSYFDLCEALPQLVASGHVERRGDGGYEITARGRETGAVVEDSLAVPVARRVEKAVARYNSQARRDSRIRSGRAPRGDGGEDFIVSVDLNDESGRLMRLELSAPGAPQARRLETALRARAEEIFQTVMGMLLDEIEGKERD